MELKPFERKKEDLEKSTFNRTFMELKRNNKKDEQTEFTDF